MKKQLVIPPFPSGAESNGFIAALSSAVCCAKEYTDDTLYWCNPKGTYCKRCGNCHGQSVRMHQESIYHTLLTASGLAFTFDYPEDDSVGFHTIPNTPIGWRWDEPFIANIMDFIGFSYKRAANKSISEIRELVKPLIDSGYPAMAANYSNSDYEKSWNSVWSVICGYTENGILVMRYGGDIVEETDGTYEDILFLTGEAERKQTYNDILKRIHIILADPSHDALEAEIMNNLLHVTPENAAELSYKMMGINGVPIETRWHAAEAFISCDNLLSDLCDDEELQGRLSDLFLTRYIESNGRETHGIGWKIWECLGVGPNTGYMPTEESFMLIQKKEVQEELMKLYKIVFENDRIVSGELEKYLLTMKR